MPNLFIVPMPDDFTPTHHGRIRYQSVDIKTMKPLKEVPEITGTCVDAAELMKQAREGVRFFKVINE